MSTSTRLRGLAAITASAALVVGTAGTASAQNVIPGDRNDGRTAIVNSDLGELTILNVDRETGEVSLEFVNESTQSLRCEAPNQDENNRPGSTVSTAPVVDAATEYYERFQVVPAGELEIDFAIPVVGGIDIFAPFWPLLQLVPSGSAAQFLSERVQLQSVVVEGHRHATTSGLAGTANPFTVAAGETATWDVPLNLPTVSPRGEDEVGAIIVCGPGGTQGSQQLYAWSAYESGEAPQPDPDTGSLAGGSLGSGENGDSGSLGSLGSSDEPEPTTPAEPDPEPEPEPEPEPDLDPEP